MSAPFCFELISPQGSILLQALSQEEVSLWTSVIQNNTARLLGTHMERRASIDLVDTPLGAVRGAAGNRHCADCGADDPTWASINLGVVLCTRCAGAHRQLGVHISKVRSLDLDVKEWSDPLLALMKGLGNECQNRVWQAQLPASQRLAAADVDERRRLFVTQKWASRAFVVPPDLRDAAAPTPSTPPPPRTTSPPPPRASPMATPSTRRSRRRRGGGGGRRRRRWRRGRRRIAAAEGSRDAGAVAAEWRVGRRRRR